MDKVQKHNSFNTNTPSSESYRNYSSVQVPRVSWIIYRNFKWVPRGTALPQFADRGNCLQVWICWISSGGEPRVGPSDSDSGGGLTTLHH